MVGPLHKLRHIGSASFSLAPKMDSVPATPSGRAPPMDDFNSTPIVDGSILEASKENIQPLARGRRATALSAALSTPHKDRGAHLKQERERMRAELDAAIEEEDDPLAAYIRFVDWTIESYPQGHNSDSGLISLFHEATHAFKDDDRYKNDIRYLKLWIMYSAQVEKPVDIFKFLVANDIGSMYALLYEEFALALERDGSREDAEDTYRLGINRRARPLERLEVRYKEFTLRMMSGVVPPAPEPPAPSTAPTKKRKALGQVKSSVPLSSTAPGPQATTNARLQPFVDGEEGPVQEPGNEWPEFGTRAGRVKENQREVSRAGDAPYKLSRPPIRTASAPIIPFCDEEEEEPDVAPQTPSTHKTNVMTPARGSSEAELLRRDPFVYYDKAPASPTSRTPSAARPLATLASNTGKALKASTSSRAIELSVKSDTVTRNPYPNIFKPLAGKRTERHMLKPELLWNEEKKEESCIAEARARHLGLRGKQWPTPSESEMELPSVAQFKEPASRKSKARIFMTAEPTVTINTKAALNDVYDMFNGTETIARAEPTVTFNTKAALNDVYDMFNVTETVAREPVQPDTPAVPVFDENAGALKRSVNRVPSTPSARAGENALGPPSTIRVSKTPKPTDFATPILTKLPSAKKGLGLSQRTYTSQPDAPPVFAPFRDREESTPTKAKSNLAAADEADDSVPFTSAAKTVPSFKPFADVEDADTEDESVVFSTALSFKPFVDGDEDDEQQANEPPAFQPFVDGDNSIVDNDDPFDEDEVQLQPGFRPFVDETEGETEDHSARQLQERQPPFQVYAGDEEDEWVDDSMLSSTAHSGNSAFESSTFNRASVRSIQSSRGRKEEPSLTEDSLLPQIVSLPNEHNVPELFHDRSFEIADNSGHLPFRLSAGYTIDARNYTDTTTLEFTETVGSGSLLGEIPNPCNPYAPEHTEAVLAILNPDSRCHNQSDQESGKWDVLKRRFDGTSPVRGRKSLSADATANLGTWLSLRLGDTDYEISGKLGEGAFGAVFAARDCTHGTENNLRLADSEDEEGNHMLAIKIVRPSSRWEFTVLSRLIDALPPDIHPSVITPRAFFEYSDESFLIMERCVQGTLLDVVNRASQLRLQELGAGIDEQLVIFFTVELLRIVTEIHRAGFIHGDMKIDNWMLRLDEDGDGWSNTYDPTGEGGWRTRGVRLIDFGRTIDKRLYPEDQEFVCDWKTDAKDCVEAQEGRAWTFQSDYYGLATVIYTMLFGKHFEGVQIRKDADGTPLYTVKEAFKRYWQPVWPRLFNALLNPARVRADHQLPICDELTSLRKELEQILVTYKKPSHLSTRTASLKTLLRKIQGAW
ncbi:hypothetical protein BKA62DRAFT_686522 [Auriculariales sp. MPI-PUGE-AT-0066]|nr:hypothetical protein BKA62DRAFT_686522 [Auriculariales sp. MPI-PUGE-AT-0066]